MGLILTNETKAPLFLLIDADLLVYRAGFSCQSSTYSIRGDVSGLTYKTKKQAVQFCEENAVNPDAIAKDTVIEDWGICKARLNTLVENTVQNCVDAFEDYTRHLGYTAQPIFFLTGCDQVNNFREDVDPGYKANRADTDKPPHYNAIRTHIQNVYNTVVTQGAETDDYLGPACADAVHSMPEGAAHGIIVSIDKDLDMIPGWHFNFVKNDLYFVEENKANRNFFTQMLTGDSADNIKGLHRVGPKNAEKILGEHAPTSDMLRKAQKAYAHHFPNHKEIWDKNCDLLWIWRTMPDECPYKYYMDSNDTTNTTTETETDSSVPF